MPGEPVDLGDFGFHEAYLIESRSIGGLSGSPVVLPTAPFRISPEHRVFTTEGHERSYLLGINIGLFETLAHADRVLGEKLDKRQAFLETMNAGIAVVLPIQRIAEILSQPELVKRREDAMAEWKPRDTGFRPSSAGRTIKLDETVLTTEAEAEPEPDNPFHKEDFTSLLGRAATTKPKGG